MLVKIFSVPHTGTLFVKDLLESHGLAVKAKHIEGYQGDEETIIIPLRDPEKTCKSWSAKNRPGDFIGKWKAISDLSEKPNVHYLPIDTKDRDEHLNALSKVLGVELATDWTPVNSLNEQGRVKMDLEEVYNLPIVKKHYGKQEVTKKRRPGRPKKVLRDEHEAQEKPETQVIENQADKV